MIPEDEYFASPSPWELPDMVPFQDEMMPPFSILLLRPECNVMLPSEIDLLHGLVQEQRGTYGEEIQPFPLRLDMTSAIAVWMRDVERYPWAYSYCSYMASNLCLAFVLKGNQSARLAKASIRGHMRGPIERLREQIGMGFIPDLVHGSDPEDGYYELPIFLNSRIQLDNTGPSYSCFAPYLL